MCKIERSTVILTKTYAAVCSNRGIDYFGGKPACVEKSNSNVSTFEKIAPVMSADLTPIRIPCDSVGKLARRSHGRHGKKPTYAKHQRDTIRMYIDTSSD